MFLHLRVKFKKEQMPGNIKRVNIVGSVASSHLAKGRYMLRRHDASTTTEEAAKVPASSCGIVMGDPMINAANTT